jgi:hypothetical protein
MTRFMVFVFKIELIIEFSSYSQHTTAYKWKSCVNFLHPIARCAVIAVPPATYTFFIHIYDWVQVDRYMSIGGEAND